VRDRTAEGAWSAGGDGALNWDREEDDFVDSLRMKLDWDVGLGVIELERRVGVESKEELYHSFREFRSGHGCEVE
jgi:hypothetical protein